MSYEESIEASLCRQLLYTIQVSLNIHESVTGLQFHSEFLNENTLKVET